MKKILVLLAIGMIVGGAAWAQASPPPLPIPLRPGEVGSTYPGGVFPMFNAVPTISTEKRFSAGRFSSDVDDYIDPVWYNGQIGTFVFAGGFPAAENVVVTNPLTAYARPGGNDRDTISLGFGKTIGEDKYVAIYYGGFLVDASGFNFGEDSGNPGNQEYNKSQAVWRNKLAVLFGTPSIGGLRLDLFMNNTTSNRETVDGEVSYEKITGAPSIALGWGKLMGKFAPWVKLGFKFPDTTVYTNVNSGDSIEKAPKDTMTEYSDARLGLLAGIWLETGETTSILAELQIGGAFPTSYRGDTKEILGVKEYEENGAFGADLFFRFQKELTFGDVTVRVMPKLWTNFTSYSKTSTKEGDDDKKPSDDWFTLGTGIDVGARYVYDKIGIYTGMGLNFFELNTFAHLGGEDKIADSQWTFKGMNWDSKRFASTGNLGFGITFTPIKGLVLGTGITLFTINPTTMTIQPPTVSESWEDEAGWKLWGKELNITLSYRF